MDFPRFDGTNPQEWLWTTEKYFAMVYVPDDAKFDYAQMYVTGKADTWLRNSGVLEEELTWARFCKVLLKRFTEISAYDVVNEFNTIKQGTSTVSEYTDRFEDKMAKYRKENPDVKEGYYVKCYINGLRPEIKHYMKPLKPGNLYDAVEHARDMELAVNAQQGNSLPIILFPEAITATLFNTNKDFLRSMYQRKIKKNQWQNQKQNSRNQTCADTVARNSFSAIDASNTNLST
jgi:hypothetical protein